MERDDEVCQFGVLIIKSLLCIIVGVLTISDQAILCLFRSVAFGQRAPNRSSAREEGRGLGAGMRGASGQAAHDER